MKKTRVLALVFAVLLILCGCSTEGDPGEFNTKVDKKPVVSEMAPADGASVSLNTTVLQSFLDGYSYGKGLTVAGQGDQKIAAPVELSWKCSVNNDGYTVIYTTQKDFSDAVSVETKDPEAQLSSLFVNTTYYWQVITHTGDKDRYSNVYTFHTADTPRVLDLGVSNHRDIGGYLTADGKHRVKQGMIYRGVQLENVSAQARDNLLSVCKIKTDLDLRNPKDSAFTGISSPLGDSVKYINVQYSDYHWTFNHPETVKAAVEVFTQAENYPVYIHCAVGRDRTGTLCYLLGALLGVPEEKLDADYEMTYLSRVSYAKDDPTGHEYFLKFMEKFKALEGATIQEKTENYFKSIGITDEQIQAIRQNMLTPVN